MAKRFIDPNWKALRKLEHSLIECFFYCWDKADTVGVYEYDPVYIQADLGLKIKFEDLLKLPNVKKISCDKLIFTDFITVNYGALKEGYNPHKPAFRDLLKNNLKLNESFTQACFKLEDEEEDKDEEEDEDKKDQKGAREKMADDEPVEPEVMVWPTFDDFWDLYEKKVDRKVCEPKWDKLKQPEKEAIMGHVPMYKLSQPDKQFRKDPETYLNRRSWENEIIVPNGKQSVRASAEGRNGAEAFDIGSTRSYR